MTDKWILLKDFLRGCRFYKKKPLPFHAKEQEGLSHIYDGMFLVRLLVLQDILNCNGPAKNPVYPDFICDNDRHKNQSHPSHYLQSVLAGRGVEDGKTECRVDTGRNEVRKKSDYSG